MEIQAGKYALCSDPYCYWIMEELSGTRRSRRRVTGYYRSYRDLLNDFVDNKIRASDARDMETLLIEIEQVKMDVESIISTIKGGKYMNKNSVKIDQVKTDSTETEKRIDFYKRGLKEMGKSKGRNNDEVNESQ